MGKGEKSLPLKLRVFVYLSHTLSSWGDRMWSFSVGLFMVIISPGSLRLTAFYGLSNNIAILLFGAIVGNWVDKTPRLKAARITLIIQNTSVAVCAVFLFFVIEHKAQLLSHEGALQLCFIGIIAIAIISNLASMGTSLALQRDWIVEITKLVAPIATGQIMYFASPGVGALFIAGWNLASVFVEYVLLWKVYVQVPALRSKKKDYKKDQKPGPVQEETPLDPSHAEIEIEMEVYGPEPSQSDTTLPEAAKTQYQTPDLVKEEAPLTELGEPNERMENSSVGDDKETEEEGKKPFFGDCCRLMFSGVFMLWRGWKTFMKYDVAFAGIGLAFLYMTVLGFDNITVGYAYSQGVNESIMGALMAAGSITGILGTFLYPVIRRRIGLERTGLFGFFFEICFLCLCVASVWAPGSPFDPFFTGKSNSVTVTCDTNFTRSDLNMTGLPITTQVVQVNDFGSGPVYNVSALNQTGSDSLGQSAAASGVDNTTIPCDVPKPWQSYISVALLMTGIIGARCGLWMADLTITQLFLENIKEKERGIVSGTQTSLNKLMDMLKFAMVVVAPQAEVFGILVLISFAFICLGWLSYSKYSYKARGHLFHFEKFKVCQQSDAHNNNLANGIEGNA